MHQIDFIDSHTEGEPTRTIVGGFPSLGGGTVADQLAVFRDRYDQYRSAIVNEPRGSDVLVGALLCPPSDPTCAAGVIFFNNVGYLGMCGHGTIGVVRTLAYQGRIGPGTHRLETCVGVVTIELAADGRVSFSNVESYRTAAGVAFDVPGIGRVSGDVAWAGNWFYLVRSGVEASLHVGNVAHLLDLTTRIRRAVNGGGYELVDHVELFGPAGHAGGNSRNFVLCPGGAYDRSPCGTGTSAKLACLAADGKLDEGASWVQEGILGTSFTGQFRWTDRANGKIVPTVSGTAHVISAGQLLISGEDPFAWGIRADAGNAGDQR
ncbi:proline racemase family protein [Humisphaera borealis]|uniref:Proline racemase family protein n=1 Tax=Humisphaera borealis TaxID=2807512 RepID=A0A7M2WZS0_9BACT|nr:proline racemase family protein [Humisphaera borealis]QOV90986.1 proline racemase family protein [Humisphaera borealis]